MGMTGAYRNDEAQRAIADTKSTPLCQHSAGGRSAGAGARVLFVRPKKLEYDSYENNRF